MSGATFIHHDGALGDVLLSLPCFGVIRENAASVHIACRPDIAALLKETGCVDAVSSSDNSLFASLYSGPADIRAKEFLCRFDRAFVFTIKQDSPFAANMKAVLPDTKTILTVPPDDAPMHVAEFRVGQLARGREMSASALPDIPAVHRERATDILARAGYHGGESLLVVLHPGSGGKGKRWPLENYFELADTLSETYKPFFTLLLSGPAEERGMKDAVESFARGRTNVLHVADEELITVAALLSLCDLYVGNDSGITHLAAASGAEVIALFGPTDQLLWKPLGGRVHIISPPNGGFR